MKSMRRDIEPRCSNAVYVVMVSDALGVRYRYVHLADTKKDWVRVCLVQLDFSLTEGFPWRLKEEEKVKRKVFDALEIAKEEKADIICFPELSFSREWVFDIKSRYSDMIIICGSYYDENNYNICPIIIDGKIYYYAKCHRSIMESSGVGVMRKGNDIFIFQTKKGSICVLNCIDFDEEHLNILRYVNQVIGKPLNFIVNLRYDIDPEHRFQERSSIVIERPDGSRIPTFILHVNAKRTKWGNDEGGGGTTIICFEHKHRIAKYIADGLRRRDDVRYKIFEAKGEMLLLADLNIGANTNIFAERTSVATCSWYKHNGKEWVRLNDKKIW